MKMKYINPEKKTNVPPIRNIFFLDPACIRIPSSVKRTKNAHGLKPSNPADRKSVV
jgi:hypothetical protein